MNDKDAKIECGRYHELMFEWVSASLLKYPGVGFGDLNSEELGKVIVDESISSPYKFAECFFRYKPEEDENEGPWRFYPYQLPAIKYQGDIIYSGGTSTGKTLLITANVLQPLLKGRSVMVATNSMTSQTQIWTSLAHQLRNSPFLLSMFGADAMKGGNDKYIRGPFGANAHFYLVTKQKGAMLLGFHAGKGGVILGDEAAMWDNAVFPRFFSRASSTGLDGCRTILSGVPYGDLGNEYERILKRARLMSGVEEDIVERVANDVRSETSESPVEGSTDFVKVIFNREDMPDWNEGSKKTAIARYGPEDSLGYQLYVRGVPQRPEGRVFSDSQIELAFVHLEHYRGIRMWWNNREKSISCTIERCDENGSSIAIHKSRHQVENFDPVQFLKRWLVAVPCDLLGYDYGKIQDPAIVVGAQVGDRGKLRIIRQTFRIQLRGFPSPVQSDILTGLMDGRIATSRLGLGVEASGASQALPIVESIALVRNAPISQELISFFMWQSNVSLIHDDKWSVAKDDKDGAIRLRLKQHLTNVLARFMDGNDGYKLSLSSDETQKEEFAMHTASGHAEVKYQNENDHSIEAWRVLIGRYCAVKAIWSMHTRYYQPSK